jgi:hypothetical protein
MTMNSPTVPGPLGDGDLPRESDTHVIGRSRPHPESTGARGSSRVR